VTLTRLAAITQMITVEMVVEVVTAVAAAALVGI